MQRVPLDSEDGFGRVGIIAVGGLGFRDTERQTATATWAQQRFGLYARAFLLAGVFSLPLSMGLGAFENFELQKVTVLWCLAVVAVALCLLWSASRRVWLPPTRVGMAGVAFVAAYGLATVFSQAPRLSLIGHAGRQGGFIPHVLYATVMILVIALYWERPERLKEIAWVAAVASGVLTVYLLLQAAVLDPLTWFDAGSASGVGVVVRVFGTMGNPDFAGAYLAIVSPLLLFVALAARRRWRPLWVVLFGLELVAVWHTGSRGALLAVAAGLAAFGLLSRDRISARLKAAMAVGGLLAIVTLVGVLWHPGLDERPTRIGGLRVLDTETFVSRTYFWAAAGRIFLEHPIVGTGPETFYANYPPNRLAGDGVEYGRHLVDKPHNVLLEYASDSGALGLGSYLLVIGLSLWYGVRRCRRLTGRARLQLGAFVGALVAYLTQSFFLIDTPGLAATGWIMVGVIAAASDPALLARRRRDSEPSPVLANPRTGLPVRLTAGLLAGVGVVSLVVVGTRPLRADVQASRGDFALASRMNPLQSAYPLRGGLEALAVARATPDRPGRLQLLETAREDLAKALRLQPDALDIMARTADMYSAWGELVDPGKFADSIRWWQRMVEHDPTDVELMLAFDRAKGGMRAAMTQWEAAALARPDDPQGWLQVARGYVGLGEGAQAKPAVERALNLDAGNIEAMNLRAVLPKP